MKRKLFLAAILCLGCAAQLQATQSEKQQVARHNYVLALNSEHDGVRNSAIFRVLQFKAAYPQDACADFVKRLQEMSLQDASVRNRMYAFLACALLQDAKLFAAALPPHAEDEKEAYFANLHQVLQQGHDVARNEQR